MSEETTDNINATQGAINFAKEMGVDLREVEGTGVEGRITKNDVDRYLEDSKGDQEAPVVVTEPVSVQPAAPVPAPAPTPKPVAKVEQTPVAPAPPASRFVNNGAFSDKSKVFVKR